MTIMNQVKTDSSIKTIADNSTVLRIVTAGSVDNGKSTLIGRLLYDSKKILQDQLENIEAAKERYGNEKINLAFLTDGLRAEREQGITIDVAYRYFTSDKRKYILADCPGHIQYTKNMVTGASTADAAIILIDAQAGFIEQSRRHTYLSLLLGVSHVIFAVNKMDILDYSEQSYRDICASISDWMPKESQSEFYFLPISALEGDNIVNKSTNMPWYKGQALIDLLDNLHINPKTVFDETRLPVQWVIRPQAEAYRDFRAYAGTLASGEIRVGDELMVLPSGLYSKVKRLQVAGEDAESASPGLSISVLFEDDIDISRGSIICSKSKPAKSDNRINAILTWLNSKPAQTGKRYWMKHSSRWVKVMIEDLGNELNLHSLEFEENSDNSLNLNGIAKVSLNCSEDIFYDLYEDNRTTGSFIIVDENNFETVAAGMII
ncbi:MAG: GTP-binding protein [Candidatus Caenarcaniphilales bacterium]|nr:GTP-binding protein [Candidatus Caenarcaniphilales bacterium]